MVNGYVTLDLASNKIYKESLGAIKSGKPVMVVDAPNVYFADTIAISGDDVVITKGGKTITINDANAVSSEGDIQETYSIDLGEIVYDNIETMNNFDSAIITEGLYNKLISGKAIVSVTLYDGVKFNGNFNIVQNSSTGKTTTNVLVKTEKRFYYYDVTDDGMCFVSIGQLEDSRYYLLGSDTAIAIVNE